MSKAYLVWSDNIEYSGECQDDTPRDYFVQGFTSKAKAEQLCKHLNKVQKVWKASCDGMYKEFLQERFREYGGSEAYWKHFCPWGDNVGKVPPERWAEHSKAICDHHNNVILKKYPVPESWSKHGFKVIEVEIEK